VDGWNVAQTELLQGGQLKAANRFADMLQRCTPCVTIVRSIRCLADPDRIQNYEHNFHIQ